MNQALFYVNTTIMYGKDEGRQRLHFPFSTSQVGSVEEFCGRLERGLPVYGWRLILRRDRETRVHYVEGSCATLITREGVAMIQDWSQGEVRDEREAA